MMIKKRALFSRHYCCSRFSISSSFANFSMIFFTPIRFKLMGSKEIKIFICCMVLILKCIEGQDYLYESRNSLDSFIHNSALNSTRRIRTGISYDIQLPSNFSGISASFIHIRSSRLWSTGVNFSFFSIPPKTLSWPYSKRIRIVSENLGNKSSYYYNLPNYTFITPIVGFLGYDAANLTSNRSGVVEIRTTTSDPVLIRFPNVSFSRELNVAEVQCVQFKNDGEVMEFSDVNVSTRFTCIARGGHGHFGLVIPSLPIPVPSLKKSKTWKWWVIGFVVGICGLSLLIGVGILVYRCFRSRKIEKMEKESKRGEALESIWVGASKMPRANDIRTQPILENRSIP